MADFAVKKRTLLLCAAVVLCLCAGVIGAALAVHFTDRHETLAPDTLPEAETRAVPTPEEPPEESFEDVLSSAKELLEMTAEPAPDETELSA